MTGPAWRVTWHNAINHRSTTTTYATYCAALRAAITIRPYNNCTHGTTTKES